MYAAVVEMMDFQVDLSAVGEGGLHSLEACLR
jgi:hypothetical protein